MKKWLAEFRIGSEMSMQPAGVRLRHDHPDGRYSIIIRDAHPDQDGEGELIAQVLLEAPSIADAASVAEKEVRKFLHVLAYVCNATFRLLGRVGAIDARQGPIEREAWVDAPKSSFPPEATLNEGLLSTVGFLQGLAGSALIERALRWYANGVAAPYMEDQFQFFWLTIEIIASSRKTAEKVADKCQKCRGDLYCPSCQETSMHRPFTRQLIQELIRSVYTNNTKMELLFEVRNRLMHGDPREEIEAALATKVPEFTFESAVDVAGRIAWKAILQLFNIPSGAPLYPHIRVSTYVHKTWTATAVMQTAQALNPEDLSQDCRPFAGIKVEIEHGP